MNLHKKRILLLSAGFGDGHNAAAFGLKAAFEKLGHTAVVVDVFDRAHPTLNEFLRKAYRFSITHTPKIWQAIYSTSDAADFTKRRFDVFAPSARALKKAFENFEPDLVLSTYPLYAHLVERLVGRHGHLPFPFISVVTDAQSINSIWFSSPSDHYSVIDQTSADVLLEGGVPKKKINVFGFPIHPSFDQPDAFFPDIPLKILLLPSTKKSEVTTILRSLVYSSELPPRTITVVLGRHADRLRGTVATATKNAPSDVKINVIGWTDQIPTLLKTHHCVIGKAGGASVQEAMAAHCPLLINYVVPGQEEGNAKLTIDAGCAEKVEIPEQIDHQIATLLADDRRKLKSMRTCAEKAGKPAAATQIADFALSLLDTPTKKP